MTEPAAQDLPEDAGEDASAIAQRFAPPRLVVDHDIPEPDALVLIWRTIVDAVRTIRICFGMAIRLLWRRLLAWIDRCILRSLHVAWSFGTIGWGGFIGLCVYQYWR